jgi:hypothetical protein
VIATGFLVDFMQDRLPRRGRQETARFPSGPPGIPDASAVFSVSRILRQND